MKTLLIIGLLSICSTIPLARAEEKSKEPLTCPLAVNFLEYPSTVLKTKSKKVIDESGKSKWVHDDTWDIDPVLQELGYSRAEKFSPVSIDALKYSVKPEKPVATYTMTAKIQTHRKERDGQVKTLFAVENSDHEFLPGVNLEGQWVSYDERIARSGFNAVKKLPKCSEVIDAINEDLGRKQKVEAKRSEQIDQSSAEESSSTSAQ